MALVGYFCPVTYVFPQGNQKLLGAVSDQKNGNKVRELTSHGSNTNWIPAHLLNVIKNWEFHTQNTSCIIWVDPLSVDYSIQIRDNPWSASLACILFGGHEHGPDFSMNSSIHHQSVCLCSTGFFTIFLPNHTAQSEHLPGRSFRFLTVLCFRLPKYSILGVS